MTNYPILDNMTDLELIMLHHEVADSTDPTDVDFKRTIELKLKEKHITAIEKEANK